MERCLPWCAEIFGCEVKILEGVRRGGMVANICVGRDLPRER